MALLILFIAAAIVCGVLGSVFAKDFKEAEIDSTREKIACMASTVFQIFTIMSGVIVVFCGVGFIFVHNEYSCERKRIELNEQRESLVFFIENSGTGAIALADSVAEFNANIINGRRALDNFWLKDITYPVYDDIEPINLQEYIDYDNGVLV